jgi:hypothetical protein
MLHLSHVLSLEGMALFSCDQIDGFPREEIERPARRSIT